jgi:uncharacterized protein (TIGR02246 family)
MATLVAKRLEVALLLALPIAVMVTTRAHAELEAATAIYNVLNQYQKALNASNTEQVLSVYADDGIFMWEFNQSVIGKAALAAAYNKVFQTITLRVEFKVAEVVQMSPEWAFARTNSSGVQTLKMNGKTTVEGNQELFVFHKASDGIWKIARYCFGSTNPPH